MEAYQIANLLELLIGACGGLGALGIIAWVVVKRRPKIGAGDVAMLKESVDGLRESVDGMREEMGEVFDRLDFSERILSQIADGIKPELPRQP